MLEFDTVISAVGIIGNIEGLGLEEVGVETRPITWLPMSTVKQLRQVSMQ